MQTSETNESTSITEDVSSTLLDQLQGMFQSFIESLPNLGIALLVLLATWGVVKVVKMAIRKTLSSAKIRRALVDLIMTLAGIAVWVLGILIAMTVLFPSVKPSSILAALGVGGIAVGFAFKDIFENFMAGAMIMLRKPMRIGDFVLCEGVEGRIEEILIRDTYIRQTDGQLVLVPNSILFKNPVYVRTDNEVRRYEVTAGVSYDTDVEAARKIIRKAIESSENVCTDRQIDVLVKEFGASSVDLNVRWWAKSEPIDMHESRDRVLSGIKAALDEADIEIPFPYRTLTFKEPLSLEQISGNSDQSGKGNG